MTSERPAQHVLIGVAHHDGPSFGHPVVQKNLKLAKDAVDRWGGRGKTLSLEITPRLLERVKTHLDEPTDHFFVEVARHALARGMVVVPLDTPVAENYYFRLLHHSKNEREDYANRLRDSSSITWWDSLRYLGSQLRTMMKTDYVELSARNKRYVRRLKANPTDLTLVGLDHAETGRHALLRNVPVWKYVRIAGLSQPLLRPFFWIINRWSEFVEKKIDSERARRIAARKKK